MAKKAYKIVIELIAAISIVIIVLPIFVSLLLQIEFFQNILTSSISNIASKKLGVEVSVDKVKINRINAIEVCGFWVENPYEKGDTLLYVDQVEASINRFDRENTKFGIGVARVNGGYLNVQTDSTNLVNIKKVVDKLKSPKPKNRKFGLTIDNIELDSFTLAYDKHFKRNFESGINYDDMQMVNISIKAEDFELLQDSISLKLNHLSLLERSGVQINKFSADSLILSPSLMWAKDASLSFDDSSIEVRDVALHYNNWRMDNFINRVKIEGSIKSSDIEMSTIEKFTGKKRNWSTKFNMIGSFEGTIDNLDCNIASLKTYSTTIRGTSLKLVGLPDINRTKFSLNMMDMHTNSSDVRKIIFDFSKKNIYNKTIDKIGWVNINGIFEGTLKDFDFTGNINSLNGGVKFAVSNSRSDSDFAIKGDITTSNINCEKIFGLKSLKNVNLFGKVDCHIGKENVMIDMNSKVYSASFNGYQYSDIDINGLFDNEMFTGSIHGDDPNLTFAFNGFVDLDDREIPKYDFNLNIDNADLNALNFNKRDSVSIFKGRIIAEGSGKDIDNVNGNIKFNNFNYINYVDTVEIGEVEIIAENSSDSKSLRLLSDFADIDVKAEQSYKNIIPFFSKTITKYLPALQKGKVNLIGGESTLSKLGRDTISSEKAQDSYYLAIVNVKETNNMASIFFPGLNIAKDSKLSVLFNPAINEFSFSANSDSITMGNIWGKKMEVSSRSVADSISLFAQASEVNLGSIFLPNMQILGGVKDDYINMSARFKNNYDGSNALVALKSMLQYDPLADRVQLVSEILPSYLTMLDDRWVFKSDSIIVDSSMVNISSFAMRGDQQNIDVNGIISKSPNDTLDINISGLNIDGFSVFVKQLGYNVKGRLDGNAKMYRSGEKFEIATDLAIKEMMLNDYSIPDLYIKSNELAENRVNYKVSTAKNNFIDANVDFSTLKFSSSLKIDSLDVKPFEPLLAVIGSNCSGSADIDVTVDNLERPLNINGGVKIKDFETTIDFTGVRYNLNGDVTIKDNIYNVVNGVLRDPDGVTAPFSGMLDGNDRYRRVKYNIGVDPTNLLCLNTTLEDNPLFYGNIWGTGDFEVNGHGNRVTMSVAARTVNNSKFYMPLTDKSTISEADFITFVKPRDESDSETKRDLITLKKRERVTTESQFVMDFNISVDSDTEVQLVIDPTLGDIIKGRGVGELNMIINPNSDIFTMTGGFEITSGDYLFTLPNFKLLNKYFTIKPGSTINWTGDPLAANLNVTAVYGTKTSLAPLLGSTYTHSVNVDCNLSLAGQLLKPDINLGISVPNADPETQSLLSSYLNTEEAISKQIFWLLFANSFYADASQTGTNVTVGMMGTAGAVTGIEFLSNQISNWISNDKFDLGFNYRPRGDMTSDEFEVNFSAPLLNNRLLLEAEGNYDFKNNTAYLTDNSKTLSGNFYVTYLLDKSGNLQVKAFSRQIDTFDENQGLQENGAGIYYKESFNKIGEIKDKYSKTRSKNRARRQRRDSIKSQKIALKNH